VENLSHYLLLALACFYIGCAEETMFRYFLMDWLLEKKLKRGHILSSIVSGALFGAAHLLNGTGNAPAIWAFICSFFLAAIYRRYGLVVAIFAHALYDFLVFSHFHLYA
jgi:membrane protease YdiL (CAAX protease family)